jgi:FAD/FMN-containing dehydrogenase
LTIDNLKQVRDALYWSSQIPRVIITQKNTPQVSIVTADGSILTANDTENADLFWAIRGGGSNFGVVTEFVFDLHPQRRTVFAGMTFFTPDKLASITEVTKTWYANAKENEGVSLATLITPQGIAFPPVGAFRT